MCGVPQLKNIMPISVVHNRTCEVSPKLNVNKWTFKAKTVSFVGHKVTEGGRRLDEERVTAIGNMPAPQKGLLPEDFWAR